MADGLRWQIPKAFDFGIKIFICILARKLLYRADLSEKIVGAVSLDNDSGELPSR